MNQTFNSYYLEMGATEGFMRAEIEKLEKENKTLYKKLQEIGENNFELKKENKNLKLTLEQMENTCKDYLNDRDTLREENKNLKEENNRLRGTKLFIENKKLKSDLSLVIKERDDNIEQNKKLKDENEYRKKIVDITPQDEKSVAEETIQDLQERIRFLEQCLDNKEKVNKQLREDIGKFVMTPYGESICSRVSLDDLEQAKKDLGKLVMKQ